MDFLNKCWDCFKTRHDIAGVTTKDVKVKYNDGTIKTNDFQSYITLYLNDE